MKLAVFGEFPYRVGFLGFANLQVWFCFRLFGVDFGDCIVYIWVVLDNLVIFDSGRMFVCVRRNFGGFGTLGGICLSGVSF